MQQAIKQSTLEARRQFRNGLLTGLVVATIVLAGALYLSTIIYV